MTQTNQTQSERKHYHERTRKFFVDACCYKEENKNRRCGWLFSKSDCPSYQPKEKKDDSRTDYTSNN